MLKCKVQEKRDDGKGSGGKPSLIMRSADKILKSVDLDPGMERILAFMKGAKLDPEEIFDGDYFKGDKPPPKGTGYKLK